MALLGDYLPQYGTDVLNLPREELAVHLLKFLRAWEADESKPFTMRNLITADNLSGYVPEEQGQGGRIEMSRKLSEAWAWLVAQVYISADPNYGLGGSGEGYYVTDAGREFLERAPTGTLLQAEHLLPVGSLHPLLEKEARPEFIRGALDKAIFGAMRVVEIEVRKAAGLDDLDLGTSLMRKAFDSQNGPLRDEGLPEPERQNVAHLFAGAIGTFKNPASHREVDIHDPVEAANIIRFADALLRIVDRSSTNGT